MQPYIRVQFAGLARDPSVEMSVHRWIARLEAVSAPIHDVVIRIEQASQRCTVVRLRLALVDGSSFTTAASHAEIYVAVGDAFRAMRRQLLALTAAARDPSQRGLRLA